MKPQFTRFTDAIMIFLLFFFFFGPSEVRAQPTTNHVASKPLDTAAVDLRVSKGFSQVPEFLSCWRRGGGGLRSVWKPTFLQRHVEESFHPAYRPAASRGRGRSGLRQQRSAEVAAVPADLRLLPCLAELRRCAVGVTDVAPHGDFRIFWCRYFARSFASVNLSELPSG